MTRHNQWFEVDRTGLAKILRRKGIEFAVFELVQNAWDEDGVTEVHVSLFHTARNRATLIVSDNSTGGFKDLTHAFTLFAESSKKGDAEKRGRFNLGEKLVLAICISAQIHSSTGTVKFDDSGLRVTNSNQKRDTPGTDITCSLRMTIQEVQDVIDAMHKLIPPAGIKTTLNGGAIANRTPKAEFTESLPTEIADAEGMLRAATRATAIRVYEPDADETPMIYEMGIPVVEHDCAFHVDVQQKVPVTLDRENVTPKFLRAMRTAVFNETHTIVSPEATRQRWTQAAIESGDAKPEAVQDYMTKRFGERRASYDVSDPEANNKAMANGYTVVHGSMLTAVAWRNVRQAGAIQPAGQLFPTHPNSTIPFEPADRTPRMEEVANYAREFAQETIGCKIQANGERSLVLRVLPGMSAERKTLIERLRIWWKTRCNHWERSGDAY